MSKADEVYRWLLEQFASGAIAEGERLPSEPELARRFSSSRPPVRQALARLVHEGLVETRQGKGSFRISSQRGAAAAQSDIAVLLPFLSGYIYPELVEAAGVAIRERGYHALFACSEGSPAIEADILQRLLERAPQGIIISPVCPTPAEPVPNLHLLQKIRAAGIPILVLDHELEGFSSLFLDDYGAGQEAARYLFERRMRRAAVVWKEGHRPFYYRKQGFIDEWNRLVDAGSSSPVAEELLLPPGPESAWTEPIRAFLESKLRGQHLPLAFFCANDTMALAVRTAALGLGIKIPQDISLIGFDDSPLARISEISLTSFRYPSRQLGAKAVELIFDHIAEQPYSSRIKLTISPLIIERSSVLSLPKEEPL
ncbi:substrate-binding domain-containing protein [Gracilinema caldarium]|uniref:GntR family transcriptional regulator n=1 Tax=Gracilinema caldarium TaxID=215591 RepID=UPI0026F135AC|nr:substrate-binding domain-containing protein [Gracilinema caldarium]